ncbi:MAG: hypothetical protein H6736_00345 [Alphaproteobacteria bacterium]|nr:hypothetical protein [Alphaproteobacteria bacterium]
MTRIAVAAESRGDAGWIHDLIDRVLVEAVKWLEPEQLPYVRSYPDDLQLDLHHAFQRARAKGLSVYGHFRGEPGASDAQMFRAALALLADEYQPPDAAVLSRDLDDDPDRRRGLEQARAAAEWPFAVLGALANPEIEAWQVAAFEPDSEDEREILKSLRKDLGFQPHEHPERLTSTHDASLKDAKRVCKILFAHRDAREAWLQVPLERLVERGDSCGLADFIADARSALPSLLDARPNDQR